MYHRSRIFVVALVAVLLTGCAGGYSAREAAYRSGDLLLVANQQVKDECKRSYAQGQTKAKTEADPQKKAQLLAQGIPPFTVDTCLALRASYVIAKEAAKKALLLTRSGSSEASVLVYTAEGIDFLFKTVVKLHEAGVEPVADLKRFVDLVNSNLLKGAQ